MAPVIHSQEDAIATMETLSPLVWSEGMHLAQHHFQAQSRYFENTIAFVFQRLFPVTHGLLGCEFDADALRNGVLSLVHARGVMRDGLLFNFPESDQLPPSRDIRDLFRPTEQSSRVLLAVPRYRAGGANCVEAGGKGSARYLSEEREVDDEIGGEERKVVRLGRKNFRLLLESEPHPDDEVIAVAKIRRDGSGNFEYDARFIPPILQIGANRRMMDMLSQLVDTLTLHSDALATGQTGGRDLTDKAQEFSRLWLRHTIHSSLGPLKHHLAVRRSSPEQVYADLAQLAGALCTFTLDANPSALPPYDHEDLETTFGQLDAWIRKNLGVIDPKKFVGIPLVRVRTFLFTGAITDPRAMRPARWILEVKMGGSGLTTAPELTGLIKVCSAVKIAHLVQGATKGLTITHLPVPPAEIPVKANYHYFALALEGPCWESIVSTNEIGVFAPDAARVTELNLLAVLR